MLTSLRIPLCLVAWLLAPAIGQDAPPKPGTPGDPEAQKAGRSQYLGRPVARTMHWTGAPWLLRETREKEEMWVNQPHLLLPIMTMLKLKINQYK